MSEKDLFRKKYRSRYERLAVILEACCSEPQTMTAMFHALGCTYADVRQLVAEAQSFNLLRRRTRGKTYLVTLKGKEYLMKWRSFLKFLKVKEDVAS